MKLLSPTGLLASTAVIGGLHGALHLLGLREDTTFLSGTAPPSGDAGIALGLIYVVLHFAWVVGAPILVLGAGAFWGLARVSGAREGRG